MAFEPPATPPSGPPPGAQRVEGRTGQSSEIRKALKMPKSADFYLMHHPNGWRLEETSRGHEMLPVLKALPLIPGVNRVEVTPDGPRSVMARTKLKDNGWTVLEGEQDEYRRIIDVAGGEAHRMVWDRIDRYPDGTYDIAFDAEGFADYRRSLVERGIIQPPRPRVVAKIRARLQRRTGRRTQHLHVPAVVSKQDRDEEQLDAIDGALDALRGVAAGETSPRGTPDTSPKPKRRRRSPAKPKPEAEA